MPHFDISGPDSFQVHITVALVLTAWLYLRGWLRLRAASASATAAWRVACWLAGLLSIWVAVGSPLAALDHEWLTVHMVQHLLLMSVSAPLIWLAAPVTPILGGMPRRTAVIVGSLLRNQPVRHIGGAIAHPLACWLAAVLTLTIWHVPAVLTLAMHSQAWHLVQQASFLVSGLLFWWPIVRPWADARAAPQGWMVLYLFLATLPCDVLSASLVFSERVAYPVYLVTSERSVASVLNDQARAGALMWTCVTIIYMAAASMLTLRLLVEPDERGRAVSADPMAKTMPSPMS